MFKSFFNNGPKDMVISRLSFAIRFEISIVSWKLNVSQIVLSIVASSVYLHRVRLLFQIKHFREQKKRILLNPKHGQVFSLDSNRKGFMSIINCKSIDSIVHNYTV